MLRKRLLQFTGAHEVKPAGFSFLPMFDDASETDEMIYVCDNDNVGQILSASNGDAGTSPRAHIRYVKQQGFRAYDVQNHKNNLRTIERNHHYRCFYVLCDHPQMAVHA